MNVIWFLLRLAHIFGMLAWLGAGLLSMFVLIPFARSQGPEGMHFLERMMSQSRYGKYMAVSSLVTVLSGFILFWRDSSGFQWAWIASSGGLVLTLGALAGIGAFLVGVFVHGPTSARLAVIGKEVAAAGVAPNEQQMAEMRNLQNRTRRANQWSGILMVLALVLMVAAFRLPI